MSSMIIFYTFGLNAIYYLISQKLNNKIFIKYFINFILYSLFIFINAKLFNFEFIFNDYLFFFVLYVLFFISFFLTISAKYIKSPPYLIFQYLKKRRKKKDIINFLEKKKIISLRIQDLEKQKIILIKNNKISLKNNLGFFINILFLIKKFFNLKSEG